MSSNATTRIGILGCAEVAKYALIDAVRQVPGLSVAAVAGRDFGRAKAYALEHGVPRVFETYNDLVGADDVDLVYVALPNSHHCEWSIRALEHGKAVLCEKPIAANADEAERMECAAAVSRKPLIEAFHYRYHPLMKRVGDLIAQGVVGRFTSAQARWRIPGRLVGRNNIRLRYDLAGGAAMDPGCYCVDILRYVLAQEPHVVDAQAQCSTPHVDVEMQARLLFPTGCRALMNSSLNHAGESIADMDMWFEVSGEHGTLTVKNPFMPQLGHELRLEVGGKHFSEQFESTPTYVHQARGVLAVMRGERAVLTPASAGVGNMRVIDSIYRTAGLARRGNLLQPIDR
jgi:predicted dehydrogenase